MRRSPWRTRRFVLLKSRTTQKRKCSFGPELMRRPTRRPNRNFVKELMRRAALSPNRHSDLVLIGQLVPLREGQNIAEIRKNGFHPVHLGPSLDSHLATKNRIGVQRQQRDGKVKTEAEHAA